MSNVDNPHGFSPAGRLDGGADYLKIMTKLAAYATAVGINDPVKQAGTQNNFIRGASASVVLGISLAYGAASKLTTHPVLLVTENSIAECQEDGDGGAAGVDAEGANANFVVATASSTTGISQVELNSDTVNTTSTLDLHILKVAPYPDNDGTLANARFLVLFNKRALANQTVGV